MEVRPTVVRGAEEDDYIDEMVKGRKSCQLLSQMGRKIVIPKRGRSRSRSRESRGWSNPSVHWAVLNPLVMFHPLSIRLSLMRCRGT